MVLLFYVDYFMVFSTSKNKFYDLYARLKAEFNILDCVDLKKYLVIYLYCRSYRSIHLIQPYFAQSINNVIPVLDKSISKTNTCINPSLAKMR